MTYFIYIDYYEKSLFYAISDSRIDLVQKEITYFCNQFEYSKKEPDNNSNTYKTKASRITLTRELKMSLFESENFQNTKFKYSFFKFYTQALKVNFLFSLLILLFLLNISLVRNLKGILE